MKAWRFTSPRRAKNSLEPILRNNAIYLNFPPRRRTLSSLQCVRRRSMIRFSILTFHHQTQLGAHLAPFLRVSDLGHVRLVRSLILALKTTQIASPHCVWVIRWVRFSIVLLHQKTRGNTRVFVVSAVLCAAGNAARLTAEPVTVTADVHGKAQYGFPVRISVYAPPCGSFGATALRPAGSTVCLPVRFSVALLLTSPVVPTRKPEVTLGFLLSPQSSVRQGMPHA